MKTIKRALYLPLVGLLYLISLLPFWLLYIIADAIYILMHYVVQYRRKVIDTNLQNAFPEKSQQERNSIRKKYMHYLADLIVESVKLLTISEREIKKRVQSPNDIVVREAFSKGQSVIGILGHYGNWEMNALRFSQLFTERRIIVYKTLNNKFFNDVMFKMRSRFGATLVNMKDILRRLVEYKNERTVTVLVGDQTPARPDVKYFTNFLNQPTAVFLGVERLAKLTNSAVFFCDIRCQKRGYYECTFIPMFTDPKSTPEYEITNAHVQYLEKVIRNQPEYWLWSHRRWKFKQADFQ